MERIGILVPTITPRDHCLISTFKKSPNYKVELFVVDNQNNPYVRKLATEYRCVSSKDAEYIRKIVNFAKRYESKIDFAMAGSEIPYLAGKGLRDAMEEKTDIKVIGARKKYFFERSKVLQRQIFEEVVPWGNPCFQIFNPKKHKTEAQRKAAFFDFAKKLGGEIVVKPDTPKTGKGVRVSSFDFKEVKDIFPYLNSILDEGGSALVEERLKGEEFSAVDHFDKVGHIAPSPFTRDYKRAVDGDREGLTGGMASYRDNRRLLPFMARSDAEKADEISRTINRKLAKDGILEDAFGISYFGLMAVAKGIKIIEWNAFRFPDPESLVLLDTLDEDYVDVCLRMLEGTLSKIRFEALAAVSTVAAPLDYGGYRDEYTGDRRINLDVAFEKASESNGAINVYTGAIEQMADGSIHALKSRTVEVVGTGFSIDEARENSLTGIKAIDGPLQNRWEGGSRHHIQKSIANMKMLRGKTKRP